MKFIEHVEKERQRILLKATEAGVLMKELGGQILEGGTSWRRYSFIATLPVVDANTRFFEIFGQEPLVIRAPPMDEICLFKAKYVSFLSVVNDKLIISFGATNTNGGWDRSELDRGYVYGFREIPKVIDRSYRICLSTGYGAVQIPLNNLDDHRAIRVCK